MQKTGIFGDEFQPFRLGNAALQTMHKIAFFCSRRCPGSVILAAYDQAVRWRDEGRCIISGFHTPVEKEVLRVLLRGTQPIVICPARSLEKMRLPSDWKQPMKDGRLLLLSEFKPNQRRARADLAAQRNRLVAELADEIVIAHAAPGGKTESFSRGLLDSGKEVLTFPGEANENLFAMGAKPLEPLSR